MKLAGLAGKTFHFHLGGEIHFQSSSLSSARPPHGEGKVVAWVRATDGSCFSTAVDG